MLKKKYDSRVYKEWYAKNKLRIRDSKKMAKKKYRRTDAGRAAQRRYNAKPSRKLYVANYNLRKHYGITIKQYDELLKKQNNKCAICNRESIYKLHVDHNHKSGKVRGLLCGSCNRGIGLFGESLELLQKAKEYLNK
jgi:hypothetical protein